MQIKTQDPAENFSAQLSVLRDQYVHKTELTLADLAQQVLGLGPDVTREQLQDLHAQLHKLSGSGATFGFPALSQHARGLEQTAQRWLDTRQEFDPQQWQAWVDAVLRLRLHLHWQENPTEFKQINGLSQFASPRGTHLTLVQGNPSSTQALALSLGTLGYELSSFADLATAQPALRTKPPDVLLVEMADTASGNEALTQALSQLFEQLGRRIPTIFLAPKEEYAMQLAAARAHVELCLDRSVDAPVLSSHIETLLQEGEPPMRVLVVDDDEELADHYCLVLMAAGMQAQKLNSPAQIMAALDEFNPDVLLLDLDMPEVSGAELARIIRYHERWKGLAISYLSAQTDLKRQSLAMGSGVDEFLVKPISDLQLVATMQSRTVRSRKLTALMNQDGLTGLLKHNGIKDRLAQEVDRARRQGKAMSAVMVDIDLFKRVNDSWGHPMGDQVIKTLANLLRKRLRRQDSVGRYGGEEFLAILPECVEMDAKQLLDDIRQRFTEITFGAGGQSFQVSFSAGIASTALFQDDKHLLAAADQALYQAKQAGRNQVCCATPLTPSASQFP